MQGSKPTITIGSLVLIEYNKKKGPAFDDVVRAVQQAEAHYSTHFPLPDRPVIQIHPDTAESFGVNGYVGSVVALRDRDVPKGYVWYVESHDVGLHAGNEGGN